MTTISPDSAADDLVLAAFARRLAAVDAELPRLRPWRTDRVAAGQLHVVRGRMRPLSRRDRWIRDGGADRPHRWLRSGLAAAGVAAALAVAVIAGSRLAAAGVAGGLASASQQTPGHSPTPIPVASPRPSVVATPAPSGGTRPTPSPSAPAPTSSGTPADPATVRSLLERAGWSCGVLVSVALRPLPSGLIDKLAVTAGENGSFVEPELGPGWIGADPVAAARAFKGRPLLADGAGSVWILRSDGQEGVVVRLESQTSRSGAVAWRSADVVWPAACPPPGTDPKTLIVDRAVGEWPLGPVVDVGIVRVQTPAPPPRQAQ